MYSVRTILLVGVVILGLVGYNLLSGTSDAPAQSDTAPQTPTVTVAPIGSLMSSDGLRFVGTLQAVDQVEVQAETGGRIVSVPVAIGDTVRPGQVIAQLENAAQRAALTQAEGSYEAAVASTQQTNQRSDSGLRNAQTSLVSAQNQVINTIRSAYNTSNGILITEIDQFYANPLGTYPTLRINGTDTNFMRSERVALQSIMSAWQSELSTLSVSSDLESILTTSEARLNRVLGVLNALLSATTRPNTTEQFQGQPLSTYVPNLTAQRATLNSTIQSVRDAQTNLVAAEEAVAQALIGDTTTSVSLTDAQVKQALGALQAAQANFAKTVIRSPIAGEINSLPVSVGDFVGTATRVAEVVNSATYEVVIYATADERARMALGDTVRINNSQTGTITRIAPALDSRTQKIAVTIALESTEAVSGTTVTVSLNEAPAVDSMPAELTVPITAVAFSLAEGSLLQVEEGVVAAIPVTLGQVRGDRIVVEGDITNDTEIITDARGLIVGQAVAVE